jgi:hypothetical protein
MLHPGYPPSTFRLLTRFQNAHPQVYDPQSSLVHRFTKRSHPRSRSPCSDAAQHPSLTEARRLCCAAQITLFGGGLSRFARFLSLQWSFKKL